VDIVPAVHDRYLTAITESIVWTMNRTGKLPRSAVEFMNFHYDWACCIYHLDESRSNLILIFV